MNPIKKNPLGRGLESLIPKTPAQISPVLQEVRNSDSERLIDIDITDIVPNDNQPRTDFDPEALEALTESIRTKGVMQPIVVTKNADNTYMLISGERRWRASGLAGKKTVPAIIIPAPTENERLELALIENTQRDDLKPVELAKAYKSLMERCDYRQEDVAKVAGRSRSAVANTLRLLDLLPAVMHALEQKFITEGHARVFLTLSEEQCKQLLDIVLKKQLSVRETEALAKKMRTEPQDDVQQVTNPDRDALLKEMEIFFGSKVTMKGKPNRGTIEIKYNSEDELDRIVQKLRGE